MSLFEKATREKVRFSTTYGDLSVEDLWDLPLVVSQQSRLCLDKIAIALNRDLKSSETESFVKAKDPVTKNLKFKLDIVKHIIDVKMEEAENNEKRKARDSRRQELLDLKAQKRLELDKSKTLEEIDQELAELAGRISKKQNWQAE